MQVVQVRCPECGNPIMSKQKDTVFYCNNCGTMHIRNGGIKVLDVEIGAFNPNAPQASAPWRSISPWSSTASGPRAAASESWRTGSGETRLGEPVHLGAGLRIWGSTGSSRWPWSSPSPHRPQHQDGLRPGARAPDGGEAGGGDGDGRFRGGHDRGRKPGVLQDLDSTSRVHDAKLVYLPFVSTSGGLVPAF